MTTKLNLDYRFKNQKLLETALTHRSKLNQKKIKQSNERLEFLGDAVLELVISDFLYEDKPNSPEGILTTARAAIVRTESLAIIAKKLKLGEALMMSQGEEKTGGRNNTSLLANTTEAIIGAIYKDGGISAAKNFIHEYIIPYAKIILKTQPLKDDKSQLQELVQHQGYSYPVYKELSSYGPDHDKTFTIQVFVNNKPIAIGSGKNKQEAQQQSAKKAIKKIKSAIILSNPKK